MASPSASSKQAPPLHVPLRQRRRRRPTNSSSSSSSGRNQPGSHRGGSDPGGPPNPWIALVVILAASILLFWGGIFLLAHSTVSSTAQDEHVNSVHGIVPANRIVNAANAGGGGIRGGGGGTGSGNTNHGPVPLKRPDPAVVDGNNPFEGWQPLPPQTAATATTSPNDSPACNWRACLDPKKLAQCTSFCREEEASLEPRPDLSHYPGDGTWIPDVEIVRRMFLKGVDANGNAFPPPLDDELCEPMGPRGQQKDINKDMIDAVNVTILSDDDVVRPTRILCMMYTMADAHATRVRAVRETWGGRCDGFLAFSTESDPRLPAISLPHEGAEAYGNMWQKVRLFFVFVRVILNESSTPPVGIYLCASLRRTRLILFISTLIYLFVPTVFYGTNANWR